MLPNAIVPSSTKTLAFKTRQKVDSISLETMSAIREARWDRDDPDSEERHLHGSPCVRTFFVLLTRRRGGGGGGGDGMIIDSSGSSEGNLVSASR